MRRLRRKRRCRRCPCGPARASFPMNIRSRRSCRVWYGSLPCRRKRPRAKPGRPQRPWQPPTMTVAAVSAADRGGRQSSAVAPVRHASFHPPSAPVHPRRHRAPRTRGVAPSAREAEEIFGLDAGLVLAVIQAESSFDHTAVSPVGAQGAMQIMPHTQEELGLIDPFDPRPMSMPVPST